MSRPSLCTIAVLLLLALPATGFAQGQEHAVPAEALDAIVAEHDRGLDAERAELRSFLQQLEVRRIAAEAGIDIITAETAVASLGAGEIRQLSGQLAQVDAALAGGDTLVISSTVVVIALLILIIILVS
jgi:hypothetical protein